MVPIYEPTPVPQNDGSPLRWKNCTCASGATHLDRDTKGEHRTTGARVRALTRNADGSPDVIGGNDLGQVDEALREGWPPQDHMDVRWKIPFDDLIDEISSGRGAEVSINYSAISGTAWDGSPGFKGNHAEFWNEVRIVLFSNGTINYKKSKIKVYDPLWDGRRPGIPDAKFRWLPMDLMRHACGALRMANDQPLGDGLAYAGLTRVTDPASEPAIMPTINYGDNSMIVAGGLILASSHVASVKKGQPFYRAPSLKADIISRSSEDHSYDYFGYGAPGWYAVLITTRNFADKVARPVLVFCPRTAGPVSKKPEGALNG